MIYDEDRFATGTLNDEQIVLSDFREFNFTRLKWAKLYDNRFIGFKTPDQQNETEVPIWKFHIINVATLEENIINVPFSIKNNRHTKYFAVRIFSYFKITDFRPNIIAGPKVYYMLRFMKAAKRIRHLLIINRSVFYLLIPRHLLGQTRELRFTEAFEECLLIKMAF
jgi:hypothetical protein